MTEIKCFVTDCIYNKEKVCTLKEIHITNALSGDAECCNMEVFDEEDDSEN